MEPPAGEDESLAAVLHAEHGGERAHYERAVARAYDAARNQLLDRVLARIAHAAPLLAVAPSQPAQGPAGA